MSNMEKRYRNKIIIIIIIIIIIMFVPSSQLCLFLTGCQYCDFGAFLSLTQSFSWLAGLHKWMDLESWAKHARQSVALA